MHCTGFAVTVTDTISLLSWAPVHMTLHISAYDVITDKGSEMLAYIKQKMGNHHKGYAPYIIKSSCSHSSRRSACSSLRNNPLLFKSHYRNISLCSPGSCTSGRSSLRKYRSLFVSLCRHISLCNPGRCTSVRCSIQKIHVFRFSLSL